MSALFYNLPIPLVSGGLSRRCFTYIDYASTRCSCSFGIAGRPQHIFNIGNPANETTIAYLSTRLVCIYRTHCTPR